MRQSNMLIPTLREVPKEADIPSHQLLLKAGYIRKLASGVYNFLPLGKRVLRKLETIIREEMDRTGAQEIQMPTLQPAELWEASGRWETMGLELMRLNDRHERKFALGATHEEVVTSLIGDEINSYKKLPLTVYQIQSKFRDEKRPRFGLLRGREFLMKDAYSFHETYESLDEAYNRLFEAYKRVFERCGLNFRAVIADSGAMGGKDTHEFMVLSDIGEDTIAYSDQSDYAANVEMAPVLPTQEKSETEPKPLEKIETPNAKTMQEVADFLGHSLQEGMKAIMFKVDDRFVMVVTRGDHEVNDVKLKNLFDAKFIELATEQETIDVVGAGFGSLGPINVPEDVEVIADYAVKPLVNASCGANENGYHYRNVTPERDFEVTQYADVRFIEEGDPSPDGHGTIQFAKGIEVGHVFKLGSLYADKLNASFLNQEGRAQTYIMGCYGIGVSRTLASVVEQFHDEQGMFWPDSLVPFDVHIINLNMKKDEQVDLAETVYTNLQEQSFDVLYDDRQERAGVKFNDSDLIGITHRVTIGKRANEGYVEYKNRKTGEQQDIHVDELVSFLKTL
ncbi:proline--tRNA ligase [Alkalibacillus almallahensis]|uniref:proline--tRNA ligase n=1 Tax=Alkalibacillus almallahensis TaxID=1379154 RepID=UPI001420B93E|nr:proline--tRNA ligase [Alkalibacillus almallahensis]NIK10825.1 prolyl-tRNA synthetase [Alkalibacillus almallahensis]